MMSKILRLVIATIFFCLVIISLSDSVCAADKVWIFKQVEDGFKKRTVCVSRDGIKFIQGQYVLLFKAPDWKIVVLNKQRKLFFRIPKNEFKGTSWMGRIPLSVVKQEGNEEETIAGFSVDQFESGDQTSMSDSKKLVKKVFVQTTREIPIGNEKLSLIKQLFSKDIDGLPLRISVVDDKEDEKEVLRTDWCLTKEIPGRFYSIPKGFTPAKSLEEIENLNGEEKLRVQKYKPFSRKRKSK